MWNHSVFSKNRDRLIAFDVVTDLFNATVEQAHDRGLLSGEHFSVDGTLIQAWASHKSLRRKDGSDDGQSPDDWRGQSRSNDTHTSTSDPARWSGSTRNWSPVGAVTLNPERDSVIKASLKNHQHQPVVA